LRSHGKSPGVRDDPSSNLSLFLKQHPSGMMAALRFRINEFHTFGPLHALP